MNKTETNGDEEEKEETKQDRQGSFMNMMHETEEDEDEVQDEDEVEIKDSVLNRMEERGFDPFYLRLCLEKHWHTYGTTGYHLLDDENNSILKDVGPSNI